MNVEAAINNRLKARAELLALTADIQPGHSDEGIQSNSWVRWAVETSDVLRDLDGGKSLVESLVVFDVFARTTDSSFGFNDALDIATEVIAAVEDQRGTFGGVVVKSVRIDEHAHGISEEVGTYHRIVESTWTWIR